MPEGENGREERSVLSWSLPQNGFLALGWTTVAIFLTVALTELRLGSLYHTALALGLAVLVWSSSRRQNGTWGMAALLMVLLIFGLLRAFTDLTLLRPA